MYYVNIVNLQLNVEDWNKIGMKAKTYKGRYFS